jgi:hypothetical protein
MALGSATFNDLGGAVTDLFAGLGASTQASLKAQGLQIEAEGTNISAEAEQTQAAGNIAEATEYGEAETLAEQNAAYTAASTNIQAAQQERQNTLTIGSQKAAVAPLVSPRAGRRSTSCETALRKAHLCPTR